MPNLEDSILLALTVHRGQVDKAGRPYILHPLRVMLRADSERERIVAVLHHVVEDGIGLDRLRQMGYDDGIVRAIDCLTRRKGESYDAYIGRAKSDKLASRVKLEDLGDNLDPSRARAPGGGDSQRGAKDVDALLGLRRDDSR